jgi:hypothetical protein
MRTSRSPDWDRSPSGRSSSRPAVACTYILHSQKNYWGSDRLDNILLTHPLICFWAQVNSGAYWVSNIINLSITLKKLQMSALKRRPLGPCTKILITWFIFQPRVRRVTSELKLARASDTARGSSTSDSDGPSCMCPRCPRNRYRVQFLLSNFG